jgi:hypothetical protein
MLARSGLFVAAIFAVGVCGVVGCDASKAELEKTRATLATVTQERDVLKAQLDAAKAQAATAMQHVADLTARLAVAPVAAPGAPAPAEAARSLAH